ncbi:hemerythrin domain-containing protein [Pseudonocardia sp. CA-107938]|uniref:hemerythrin domain-containing protein n=1 Tax=Pseudonocardia sp. CA-107938 TaxID=3240021 RepID=UPI003D8E911A
MGAHARLVAVGEEMVRVHRWLRGELAALSADLDADLAERPRQLAAHCLSFCSAVGRHHRGEDAGAFPALRAEFPELAPIVTKLEEDHELVAGLLQQLAALVEGIPAEPTDADARRIRAELGGLAAILESHFTFEERRIVDALNALPPAAGSAQDLLGVTAPD